jgi:1-acyl-sn-glycerol-3-phosphate acyltransferase
MKTLRRIIQIVFYALFRLLTRLEVAGLENIPASGGSVLCSNHVSILDAGLIFVTTPRQDLAAFVADKYKKNIFVSTMVRISPGIWLNREAADAQAFRKANAWLEKGGLLGIAPEGTRSPTAAMIPAKTGVAFVVDKASAPVIPIAITGTETTIRTWKRLRRPHIRIEFGAAFSLPPVVRAEREAGLQRNTDEIMARIAVMLPESYRGVYAEHPRLKELLVENSKKGEKTRGSH